MKHTPGPWRWLPDDGQFIVGPDDQIIAEIPCTSGNTADGPVLAEAPAMAEALRELIAEFNRRDAAAFRKGLGRLYPTEGIIEARAILARLGY